jgi:hypothetical protein
MGGPAPNSKTIILQAVKWDKRWQIWQLKYDFSLAAVTSDLRLINSLLGEQF